MSNSSTAFVGATADKVWLAHSRALSYLDSKWFKGDAGESAIAQLKAMVPILQKWQSDSLRNAVNDTPPKGGWQAWTEAANDMLQGIDDLVDIAVSDGTIELAKGVIEEAPEVTAQAVKKVGRAAANVAQAAGSVVGNTAANVVRPLMLPIIAIAGVFVLYLAVKRA